MMDEQKLKRVQKSVVDWNRGLSHSESVEVLEYALRCLRGKEELNLVFNNVQNNHRIRVEKLEQEVAELREKLASRNDRTEASQKFWDAVRADQDRPSHK